jgi:hypothetical protein
MAIVQTEKWARKSNEEAGGEKLVSWAKDPKKAEKKTSQTGSSL